MFISRYSRYICLLFICLVTNQSPVSAELISADHVRNLFKRQSLPGSATCPLDTTLLSPCTCSNNKTSKNGMPELSCINFTGGVGRIPLDQIFSNLTDYLSVNGLSMEFERLLLVNSQMRTINETLFHGLQFRYLSIYETNLTEVGPNSFMDMTDTMTYLLIKGDRLQTVFPALQSLKKLGILILNLGLNSFQQIPHHALANLPELQRVTMNGVANSIVSNAFVNLTNLQLIKVTNQLEKIESDAFVIRDEEPEFEPVSTPEPSRTLAPTDETVRPFAPTRTPAPASTSTLTPTPTPSPTPTSWPNLWNRAQSETTQSPSQLQPRSQYGPTRSPSQPQPGSPSQSQIGPTGDDPFGGSPWDDGLTRNNTILTDNSTTNSTGNSTDTYTAQSVTIDLSNNKLNENSFGPNFIRLVKNLTITLDLTYNWIRYLPEDIFRPFFEANDNNKLLLVNNKFECGRCDSYWLIRKNNESNIQGRLEVNCYMNNQLTVWNYDWSHCNNDTDDTTTPGGNNTANIPVKSAVMTAVVIQLFVLFVRC